jgi:hypothetical protein
MIIAKRGATEPMVPFGSVIVITLNVFRTVTEYLCHKLPWLCSVGRNHKSNTTGAVPLVEQELLIIPDELSLPLVCNEASFFSIFSFLCGVIQIIICLFILFHFAIV